MTVELDKDIAATMTPEELEAINQEDTPEEKAIMRQPIEGSDDDDGDDDADDGADDDGEGNGAAAADDGDGKKEDPPAADDSDDGTPAAAAGTDEVSEEPEFTPQFKVTLPDDFDDQVKQLAEEGKVLAQQFKDGDIDFDEYNTKTAELNAKRDQLTTLKTQAAVFEQMNAQSAEQRWNFTVDKFKRETAKAEGIDYRNDPDKGADLDMFVKRLANDPKNEDKSMSWFLTEAHKRVKALYGVVADTKPAEKPDPKKVIAEAKKARKPNTEAAPKTLAQVPGGDGPGDVADEFSELDGLEGLDLEQAIAKMSPAQRERWAKAA